MVHGSFGSPFLFQAMCCCCCILPLAYNKQLWIGRATQPQAEWKGGSESGTDLQRWDGREEFGVHDGMGAAGPAEDKDGGGLGRGNTHTMEQLQGHQMVNQALFEKACILKESPDVAPTYSLINYFFLQHQKILS